ncbi:hypothetical protein AX14_000455 [Amanita brunnescens Koide BX004]|nr:hypothetical protein AX14_000455 [Amanita brunnescens Koide BX004]
MPSFADLKAKAVKVKDAGIEKAQNVKDRNTSIPMKKTNWDPYSGEAPPPLPPPRVNSRSKPAKPPLPPPPSRTGGSAARTPSLPTPSAPALPGRPVAGPPRLPARTPSSISASAVPPPLPSRGASASSLALSSSPGAPLPPPISRSTRPTDSQPPPPPAPPPPVARAYSAPAPAPAPALPQRKLETQSSTTSLSDVRTRFGKEPRIDWTNLSHEDRHAFYGWLDEYFSRSLNITLSS